MSSKNSKSSWDKSESKSSWDKTESKSSWDTSPVEKSSWDRSSISRPNQLSTSSTDEAQKKYGNAKSISSSQYFSGSGSDVSKIYVNIQDFPKLL